MNQVWTCQSSFLPVPLLKSKDSQNSEAVWAHGVSVLLVEHKFKVAMSLSERIYLMGRSTWDFPKPLRSYRSKPPSGKNI